MKDRDIIKEVFEIAFHSIQTEELMLQQENMDRYRREVLKENTAMNTVQFNVDIVRHADHLTRKRERLYQLMDEFYKEER